MKEKRVLVMTGAENSSANPQEKNSKNSSYYDVAELTLPSKEKYAKKYGYDFLNIHNFGKDTAKKIKPSPISHIRVYRAFKLLEEYDIVMWIDADSLITNQEMGVESFPIDDDHVFYASYDWGWSWMSTGNFILHKTKNYLSLFDTYYENLQYFQNEQESFNTMYEQNTSNSRSSIKIIYRKYLGSVPSIEQYLSVDSSLNQRFPWNENTIIEPWKLGDFLVHVTGIENSKRIDLLKTHFMEYLG